MLCTIQNTHKVSSFTFGFSILVKNIMIIDSHDIEILRKVSMQNKEEGGKNRNMSFSEMD